MIFRTFTRIALVVFTLFLPKIVIAGTDFCDTFPQANWVVIGLAGAQATIRNKLLNYSTFPQYLHTQDGKTAYCLIFQINVNVGNFEQQLLLTVADGNDVFIKNLNVRAHNDLASLLKIENNQAASTVYLLNSTLTNVENGITLEGTGKTELHGVNVIGDTSKAGNGISLKSPGAVLDDVEAKGCGVGVKVEASNATITSSGDVTANIDPITQISNNITNISSNKIGVHIMSGVTGTKITRSRIFGNDDLVNDEGIADGAYVKKSDTIRIDDGPEVDLIFAARPIFYDAPETEPENVAPVDENMSSTINYGNRTVYMNIPLVGVTGITGNVTVDLATSAPNPEMQKAQLYEIIGAQIPVDVPYSQISEAVVTYQIPPEYLNKKLTALYNDPRYGTTALSQPFQTSNGHIVIFVDSPFDQTSQGNPMQGGAGTTGDGETVVAEAPTDAGASGGSSGGGGGGGGAGKKLCTFIPDAATRPIPWPATLWWLLLLTAPAASIAAARPTRHRP